MSDKDKGAVDALTDRMAPTPGEALMASGQTVMQHASRNITAVRCQVERDLTTVAKRVVSECQFDPEGLCYAWKQGGKMIEGPSIKMAMILARNWGNSETEVELVSESDTHWIFKGVFYDFELGSTTSRLFRQRKPGEGKGKMGVDRQEDLDFQIGQSKAIRNSVLNAMPAGLVTRAMDAAKGNLKKETEADLSAGKQKALTRISNAFKKHGVTIEMLEAKIDTPSNEWSADDIAALYATFQALNDGETTVENEFEPEPKSRTAFGAAVEGSDSDE